MVDEQCPSCKSYLDAKGWCDVCGWTPGDNVLEPEHNGTGQEASGLEDASKLEPIMAEEEYLSKEKTIEIHTPKEISIQELMEQHSISMAKAERLLRSRQVEEDETEEEIVLAETYENEVDIGPEPVIAEMEPIIAEEEPILEPIVAEVEKETVIAEVQPIIAEAYEDEEDLEELVIAEVEDEVTATEESHISDDHAFIDIDIGPAEPEPIMAEEYEEQEPVVAKFQEDVKPEIIPTLDQKEPSHTKPKVKKIKAKPSPSSAPEERSVPAGVKPPGEADSTPDIGGQDVHQQTPPKVAPTNVVKKPMPKLVKTLPNEEKASSETTEPAPPILKKKALKKKVVKKPRTENNDSKKV